MRLAVEIHRRDTGERRTLSFATSPVRIGRSPLNNLTIEAPWISQHHGLIRFEDDQVDYIDLGSTNGTCLWNAHTNEETRMPASTPHRLLGPGQPQAELRVGPVSFVVRPLPNEATGESGVGVPRAGKLDTRLTFGEMQNFQQVVQQNAPPGFPSAASLAGQAPSPFGQPGSHPFGPRAGTPGPQAHPAGTPGPHGFPAGTPGPHGFAAGTPGPQGFAAGTPVPGFPAGTPGPQGFPPPGFPGAGPFGTPSAPPPQPFSPGESVPGAAPRYIAGHTKMAQPHEARALLENLGLGRGSAAPGGASLPGQPAASHAPFGAPVPVSGVATPSGPVAYGGGMSPAAATSALARMAALWSGASGQQIVLDGPTRAFVESLAAITESLAQGLTELKRGLHDLGGQLGVRAIGSHTTPHRSQSAAELLRYLLDPTADTRQRLEELVDLFADLMLHEVALLNGIKQGLHHLVHELDPEGGYAEHNPGGIGLFDRSLKRYREYFQQQTEDDGHKALFGDEFAQAYADAVGLGPGDRKRRP